VAFATSNAPAVLRADALNALAWFAKTPKLDRVEGRYRELGDRDPKIAQSALDAAITRLLKDPAPAVRNATVQAIQQLHFDAARDRLAQLAMDGGEAASVRVPALRAIYALGATQAGEAARRAMASDDARLRAAGLEVLAKLEPAGEQTLAHLKKVLAGEPGPEQQAALAALGGMKSEPAVALLEQWVDRLVAGKVPPAVQLDVLEAGQASKARTILAKLRKYTNAKPKGDAVAKFAESFEGGDGAEGEAIFRSGQCLQCHTIGGVGGNVGPDLSHVASRLPRRELLESVVSPNAKIVEGYGTISVTTKDGDTVTGTLQKETADSVTLKSDDGEIVTIKAADVQWRTKPSSAMPAQGDVLKARGVRDVVEFLSTLK
jgi:putative heme-binding domain-containing protein